MKLAVRVIADAFFGEWFVGDFEFASLQLFLEFSDRVSHAMKACGMRYRIVYQHNGAVICEG